MPKTAVFSFKMLRHCISILLLLVTSVQSDCERGGTCSDADKLLADIAADPKSHQQLLQAFYPINRAQPAYMVVAYFVNFTGAFPEQCDGHTYPWTKFAKFNTTHIWWYLWSTLPANNVVNIQLMTEFGLSVPAQSYYALFNTAPWWLEVTTTTACVALPYNDKGPLCVRGSWCNGPLVRVTAEVRAQPLGHMYALCWAVDNFSKLQLSKVYAHVECHTGIALLSLLS